MNNKKILGYVIITIGFFVLLFWLAIFGSFEEIRKPTLLQAFWMLIKMFVPIGIATICFRIGVELIDKNKSNE